MAVAMAVAIAVDMDAGAVAQGRWRRNKWRLEAGTPVSWGAGWFPIVLGGVLSDTYPYVS